MPEITERLPFFAEEDGPATPVHMVCAEGLEGLLDRLGARVRRIAAAQGFKAAAGAQLLVHDADGALERVLFGTGPDGDTPLIAGRLGAGLPEGVFRIEDGAASPGLAALAFALGGYRFERYRTARTGQPRLVIAADADAAETRRLAAGVYLARDLINTASNDQSPADLAAAARKLAERHGARFTLVEGNALERDFPMIHAVGAGSERAPALIDFIWGKESDPKITLIGKGVVFDTGGLDIKPSSGKLLMKKDKGGAANVLGLAAMVMDAGLKVRLRVLIPAVENSISGRAFRPGDVLRSRKGLTVEIGNTDAEGRLVLADAMALADEEAPELMVTMATLTGAARVALGPDIPPFYTDDDGFAEALAEAAKAVADPVWRMPFHKPYDSWLSSKIADLNHISANSFAGSIVAALFLRRFVSAARTYAHFDIYAWNSSAKPGGPEGGEAQAIRALYQILKTRYG